MPIGTGVSGDYVFSLLSQVIIFWSFPACPKRAKRQWVLGSLVLIHFFPQQIFGTVRGIGA
jgi:hypothetical protein